ncbi:four helix bundle protein [Dehalogenimonas formicexedens]|uniref:Four helix bundle protein n=1 Tax=Dehalogenimonas formicexedens TaxID=1839801 RepID=A0A1P8FAB4_9CHLR|nr:four helix bundle protein [Dehalogenimonas formicexedens]APV45406.1 four helix bundle protein [Dehalogenimonas formicexedens]
METVKPKHDLEERTLNFAKRVVTFVGTVPQSLANVEIIKQLVRSSGSIGANYIEANEAISKKDFTLRVKICRKEAKETRYWLQLIEAKGDEQVKQRELLFKEATEITKIFGAIVDKTT